MSKSASHAVSTREPYVTPGATGPRGDIGRGLIRHVIQILTWNIQYLSYALPFTRNSCNTANACAKHQSINPLIYNYLLLTIKLTYFLSVRFVQMAAGFTNFSQEDV